MAMSNLEYVSTANCVCNQMMINNQLTLGYLEEAFK